MTPELTHHAHLRSRGSIAGLSFVLFFYVLTSWTEGMQHFWRVSPWVPTLGGGFTYLVLLGATWIYKKHGQTSHAYRRVNALETLCFATTCGSVIFFSGYAENPMWIFHFGHIVQCGLAGFQRKLNFTIFALTAAVIFLKFLFTQSLSESAIVFLLGAFSVLTYALLSRTSERLRTTTLQRDALAGQLAELRVADERQRIARDLHDGFASDLAALHWQLEGLRASLPSSDVSEQYLNTLSTRLTQGSEELRNIVWALRAQDLSWGQLGELLKQRCRELVGEKLSYSFEVSGPSESRLAPDLQAELTRCMQEAVRNAVRHGQASKLRVQLHLNEEVRLCIEDNGKGLSAQQLANSSGGLHNLRDRVEKLRGTITFESAQPGTRLVATLPLVVAAKK